MTNPDLADTIARLGTILEALEAIATRFDDQRLKVARGCIRSTLDGLNREYFVATNPEPQ